MTTADVVGVADLPEHRGGGVARALPTALLAPARERGAAVSAVDLLACGPRAELLDHFQAG